jgi:energy-coupling factor transporter ATP-binding protein EcfA2/uncharacterized membrane protein
MFRLTLDLLQRTGKLPRFVAYQAVETLIAFLTLLWSLHADAISMVVVISFLDPLYQLLAANLILENERAIVAEFTTTSNRRFSALNYASRQASNIDHFTNLRSRATDAITWTMYHAINLLKNVIVGCVCTVVLLCRQEQYLTVTTLLVCNALALVLIIRPQVAHIRAEHKARSEQRKNLSDRESLLKPRFAAGEIGASVMTELNMQQITLPYPGQKLWDALFTHINLVNALPFVTLLIAPTNPVATLATIALLKKFASVIMSIGSSATNYMRYNADLADFEKFWADKLTDPDVATQTMPNMVLVKTPAHTFTITHGLRILITGPSGCGKSTLVHQMRGFIAGASIENADMSYEPTAFREQYVEVSQTACERLPMNTPTVRDIFEGADNKAIAEACDMVGLRPWLTKIGLDDPIANRISGGEKRRLAIAAQLASVTDTTRVIILDEPEQGCDPPLAYALLTRIDAAYPEQCIIVISHLERITTAMKWDHHVALE